MKKLVLFIFASLIFVLHLHGQSVDFSKLSEEELIEFISDYRLGVVKPEMYADALLYYFSYEHLKIPRDPLFAIRGTIKKEFDIDEIHSIASLIYSFNPICVILGPIDEVSDGVYRITSTFIMEDYRMQEGITSPNLNGKIELVKYYLFILMITRNKIVIDPKYLDYLENLIIYQ